MMKKGDFVLKGPSNIWSKMKIGLRKSLSAAAAMLMITTSGFASEYYVSAQAGASDDNPGTKEKPWATPGKAGKEAKAGDTVHIGAGTYRDNLQIINSGKKDAPITFAGEGKVLITGADKVSGFTKEGKLWVKRPWAHIFKWHWGDESTYPEVANENCPFMSAGRMENVFIDGVPMQWVPKKEDLAPGRFFWSGSAEGKGELLVYPPEGMDDPEKAGIEVPLRSAVLSGPWGTFPRGMSEVRGGGKKFEDSNKYKNCEYIILKNLAFGYTCEGYVGAGAVISGDNWTAENCVFEYMNAGGLWVGGDYAKVKNCLFRYNGKYGLGTKFHLDGALIEDCITINNNRKFYKIAWDAGGMKLHHTKNTIVRRLTTAFNFGAALWFDIECEGNTIEDCTSFGNEGLGLFYEVSDAGKFRNNVSFGNGVGIMYAHSAHGDMQDNVIIGCGSGLVIGGDREKYKGVDNKFQKNIVFEVRGGNLGWKSSKAPNSKDLSSKNMLTENLYASVNGSSSFEFGSMLPDLKSLESEYKNASGNTQVKGLENIDASARNRIDTAFLRIIKSLNSLRPDLKISEEKVHLKSVWKLGGKGNADGFWLETAGGPLLMMSVYGEDTVSLSCDRKDGVVLWNFPHLGANTREELKGNGFLVSGKVKKKFAIMTGLSPETEPSREIFQVASLQDGKPKSDFREGEKFIANIAITNPLRSPASFTVQGPGMDNQQFQVGPGEKKSVDVPQKAAGGTDQLAYVLKSDLLGVPLEQAIQLKVTRMASAKKCTDGKFPEVQNIAIDSAQQRNTNVWDEASGKTWQGKGDLSGTASVGWNEKNLIFLIKVSDNKVVRSGRGIQCADGVELFLDCRGEEAGFHTSKYADGVLHLRTAAPVADSWESLPLGGEKALVRNGNFKKGITEWFVPKDAKAKEVQEAVSNYARIEGSSIIQQDIDLNPNWGRIKVSCRARYENIVPGEKSWHTGRLAIDFKDKSGAHAGGNPEMISFKGSSKEWKEYSMEYEIPDNAVKFRLQAGMWNVKSGTLDIDDVAVVPVGDRSGKKIDLSQQDGISVTGRTVPGGYEVRIVVGLDRFKGFKPQPGTVIGFDIGLDDSDVDDSKALQSQLFWQDSKGLNAYDASRFGLIKFEE